MFYCSVRTNHTLCRCIPCKPLYRLARVEVPQWVYLPARRCGTQYFAFTLPAKKIDLRPILIGHIEIHFINCVSCTLTLNTNVSLSSFQLFGASDSSLYFVFHTLSVPGVPSVVKCYVCNIVQIFIC